MAVIAGGGGACRCFFCCCRSCFRPHAVCTDLQRPEKPILSSPESKQHPSLQVLQVQQNPTTAPVTSGKLAPKLQCKALRKSSVRYLISCMRLHSHSYRTPTQLRSTPLVAQLAQAVRVMHPVLHGRGSRCAASQSKTMACRSVLEVLGSAKAFFEQPVQQLPVFAIFLRKWNPLSPRRS